MTSLRVLANAIFAVLILVAVAGLLVLVNSFAAPHRKILPPENAVPPNYEKIISAIDDAAVRREVEAIVGFGSRFCGSEGAAKTAVYLAQQLREHGYEVIEQPFLITVPVTRFARIKTENGQPLPGVKIHPLLPNGFRTCTTPVAGVRGKVFRGEKGLAREFADADLRNQIVLLPVGAPWHVVAGMGARAILYFEQEDSEHSSLWDHSVYASLDIPRFFVEGDIAGLVGREVCLEARVDWEEREVVNVIGFLKPPAPTTEAIFLSAHYDAYAYVPDLAFGARQAVSAAVLSAAAAYLAAEQPHLQRHLIIAYTAGHGQALAGMRELMRALDRGKEGEAVAEAEAEQKTIEKRLSLLAEAQTVANDPRYWETADEGEDVYWRRCSAEARQTFEALGREILDRDWLEALEEMTQARLAWIREGQPVQRRHADGSVEIPTSFAAYEQARQRQDFRKSLLAVPWRTLKARKKFTTEIQSRQIPQRLQRLIAQRMEIWRQALRRAEARLALARRFAAVGIINALAVDLDGWSGRWALVCGQPHLAGNVIPGDVEYESQFRRAAESLDALASGHMRTPADQPRFVNLIRSGDRTKLDFANSWDRVPFYFESVPWLQSGRCAFSLTDFGDPRREVSTPRERYEYLLSAGANADNEETVWRRLGMCCRLLTAAAAQMVRGMSKMAESTVMPYLIAIRGRVVSQLGDSLVPNHLMPRALVRCHLANDVAGPLQRLPGVDANLVVSVDEEGWFALSGIWPYLVGRSWGNIVELDAAMVNGETGEITWALSQMCERGQPYNTRYVPLANYEHTIASCVLFRAAAVQVFPMPDPNTLQPYPAFEAIEKRGLAAPRELKAESAAGGTVLFVPPDAQLYFLFKKGRKENPALLDISAFALNAEGPAQQPEAKPADEISGKGYLAADCPSIVNIEFDVARSMAQLNSRRLARQQRYGMADDMMVRFQRRSAEAAEKSSALAASGKVVEAMREAAVSIAYSANIHPIIRKNAFDAICGILFYLFLAIPFVIFMEKLLIGHPDIRGQIAGMAMIFLFFFLALWATHPAFHLVRSTTMILLGFLTFTLAASVGAFVSARFSRSVGEIHRRARQEIVTADVSRASAAATAFVLGLNNLRKRPLRTGLTVATLTLITFVMICFTSFKADIADIEFSVGRADYTGILLRHRMLRDVASMVLPAREMFGGEHRVAPRGWGGSFSVPLHEGPKRREYVIEHVLNENKTREAVANAILGLTAEEPLRARIREAFAGLPLRRWFENEKERACYLPKPLAEKLLIDEAAVLTGQAKVKMGNREYEILGVFDPARLDRVLDLDGQSLMPIDIIALREPPLQGEARPVEESADIPEDQPRLAAERVVITPLEAMPERTQIASIAVALMAAPGDERPLPYSEAKAIISEYLERSGMPAYYGLDGVAFFGGRFRLKAVEGFLDLLLPLIIAALTVLNTMRGAVYERRGEIYVFNAVGLAPNHVLFLFIAEACVYAVVGAVGGYLLSQAAGFILDAAGLKQRLGMTLNYSSLATVAVTAVIMAVVLVSSLAPARLAAKLAAPAEQMERAFVTAEGSVMTLDLPFTFNRRDRIGILPYMADWFENYGEGSAAEFFSGPPEIGLLRQGEALTPFIRAITWLKPYDLGVSQEVRIEVRHDARTGDNLATVIITSRSGDKNNWERCCHLFIGLLRKRFLTWRAVSEDDRRLLWERGKAALLAAKNTTPEQG